MRAPAAMVVVWAAAAGCVDEARGGIEGQLSAEGLYADIATKTVATDALELSPSYVLWSDGAIKRRWMVLPPGTEIDTTDMDHWQLPIGTKLFKEFVVDGRRMETRMIERVSRDDYRFAPFVWLPDESDAVLAERGASDLGHTGYDVPSADDCITCHQSEPGRALGVSAVQLGAMLDQLPLSNPPNQTFPIREAALGVLHANCGHCHTPLGIAPMQTLRFSTRDADLPVEQTATYQTTVDAALTTWTAQGFTTRIVPGDPDRSAIDYRMAQRGSGDQMPPLGTKQAFDEGRAIVRAWIESLPRKKVKRSGSSPLRFK